LYTTNKIENLSLSILLKDYSGVEETIVGKILFECSNKENYTTISDKYNLEIMKKNYFKINPNKSAASGFVFYMKFTVENLNQEIGDDRVTEEQIYQDDENNQDEVNLENDNQREEDIVDNEDGIFLIYF
jgi:hypothetical protein